MTEWKENKMPESKLTDSAENTYDDHFNFYEVKEKHWKIGQIAKLFGINVQTLHYYDEIALFSPHFRDDQTGYRYYSQTQIYHLANIIYLRKQGYSIEDIKEYIENLTFKGRAANLQTQAESLEEEARRLLTISKTIKGKMDFIDNSDYKEKLDLIEVADIEERHYIEIGPEKDLYVSEIFYFYPTIAIYRPDAKIFCVYLKDDVEFFENISLIADTESLKRFHKVFPPAKVLRAFHVGRYERIGERVVEMLAFARENDLDLQNFSIHYNIVDQFVESDSSRYVTEIQIPLKQGTGV